MPYTSEVLADGPYFYWRLGEVAGSSTFADSSGNSRTGTIKTPANAGFGLAPSLLVNDTTNGAFRAPTSTNPAPYFAENANNFVSGLTAYTYEVWVKPSGTNNTGAIINWPSIANMSFGTAGIITCATYEGGGAAGTTTSTAISTSQPTHVVLAVSLSGTTLTRKLYINGALATTTTRTSVTSLGAPANTSYLGIGCSVSAALIVGNNCTTATDIDEIAIYPSALSAARVLDHYNAGIAPPYPETGLIFPSSRINSSIPTSGLIHWPQPKS